MHSDVGSALDVSNPHNNLRMYIQYIVYAVYAVYAVHTVYPDCIFVFEIIFMYVFMWGE